MELATAYLRNKCAWHTVTPRSARENHLLVVQGGPAEVLHYRSLGWDAKAVVFSIGLSSLFETTDDCFALSPWQDTWPIDGMKFDALICNQAGNHILAEHDLFRRLTALMTQGASLYVRLRNPECYTEVIKRTGREIWPQPQDYPLAMSTILEDVKSALPVLGCSLVSATENFDGLYHSKEMTRWPSIQGWDCTVYLPEQPEARKRIFIESWLIVLTPLVPKQTDKQQLDHSDLNGLHKEIEDLLETKRLAEAGLLLDKIFQMGASNADTCNLQGVLHFYRKEFRAAWESFRLAILQDGSRLDYYQNLADTSLDAGRLEETRGILTLARGHVNGVEGITLHA